MFRNNDPLVRKLRHRFLVTMTNGGMVSGLLLATGEHYALDHVKVEQDGQQGFPAPGVLYLHRDKVLYLQQVSVTDAAR